MNVNTELSATFSVTEVCTALSLPRTSFDAWNLRGHLRLSKGPGTGHTRRLTFDQVVRVAIIAELTRNGIGSGAAAGFVDQVRTKLSGALLQDYADGLSLIIAGGKAYITDQPGSHLIAYSTVRVGQLITHVRRVLNDTAYKPSHSDPWARA